MKQNEFEKLYLQFFPELLIYGKTITPDEPLIEDVIQELFMNFWESPTLIHTVQSLESYLYVSFRNNLLRKLKAKGELRVFEQHQIQGEIFLLPDSGPTAGKKEQLEVLLNRLPPRQREVIFLRYHKNKSYREISQQLGISYQVARNFSYRAIRYLKKRMKNLSILLFFIA